ncbi:hypothetical protein VT84_33680 [Gemmata sp. SH-PL17]|uniref:hypothetical protein n=1 Tax=Gemmata sp. SH-PL17 TaxID=1630693 RepID=UPI00078DB413|nr:hypothetical protein [Gemmata sp. SH-PL17]AMV29394.1 hypothetical protein VT84_33680 [Gemmata sp. SH-PL17]
MAQLTLTFDLGSQTVTGASLGGRAFCGADIVSVILTHGLAQVLDGTGRNLLDDYDDALVDLTRARLDVARAFGLTDDEVLSS